MATQLRDGGYRGTTPITRPAPNHLRDGWALFAVLLHDAATLASINI